ncbi:hypothetical protein CEXT_703171 [Caerostris extrusa]|uniref:Uncharacterized protein n=1 Tax=Caerostris extrusa TaxID=172846 RepID=A0AAV4XC08_CAEEX|nr:hypothetical protein CEXT_703171 [Caerostris extrusa]
MHASSVSRQERMLEWRTMALDVPLVRRQLCFLVLSVKWNRPPFPRLPWRLWPRFGTTFFFFVVYVTDFYNIALDTGMIQFACDRVKESFVLLLKDENVF